MSEYVLLTKFWNELERIPGIVENIAQQTKQPIRWLLIDDGSTDGGGDLFIELLKKEGIRALISKLPQKTKGNLDTLGRAYSFAFKEHREELSKLNPGYLGLIDIDTRVPSNYFEHMTNVMDSDKSLGCINAQIKGERGPTDWPRGSGKVTRWTVVESFDEFWDLDADSFLNVKATRMGLRLKVFDDLFLEAAPSQVMSKKGLFRLGRVNYYEQKHPLLVFQTAFFRLIQRRHGTEYLRGYFQEFLRGTWICSDRDIRYYYSLEYRIRSKMQRVLGIGRHRWPKAG
ncbi:MAG: glycosyltransferase [Candidatus Thorarchaeota archaeon]